MHAPDEQNPMQTICRNNDLREQMELETSLWIQIFFRLPQTECVNFMQDITKLKLGQI